MESSKNFFLNETSDLPQWDSLNHFYIGLALAVSSSIFIGSSFILQKKALLKLAGKSKRANEGGHGYLTEWLWWVGTLTMGVGEGLNFVAFGFAPASLVAPLGALSVLVTAILSTKLLKEGLNMVGKMGCAICLLGSTVIVIHSPKHENILSMDELGEQMKDPVFLSYVGFVIAVSIILIFFAAPRYGQSNILVYVGICSLLGSLSVLGCKGLGMAISETISGNNQFTNWLTYLSLFSVLFFVAVQLNYLNKALDTFNTAVVTPVFYVFFTTCVIIASGILYNEWKRISYIDILGNVCGFAITIVGIFQMQSFKDLNISLKELRLLVANRTRKLDERDAILDEEGGNRYDVAAYRYMYIN